MNVQDDRAASPRIWKWVIGAVVAAVVLLFTLVLPAEYGYDPTGVGRALGLTEMHDEDRAANPDHAIEDVLGGNDDLVVPDDGSVDTMNPLPLPNPAVSQLEDEAPKTETITVKLGFDDRTEVKLVMRKAKAVVYSWKVKDGGVYVDFHGHDPSRGKDFWVRYEEGGQEEEGMTGRSGSLVAPFDGEHGWYWLNTSQGPVTIELTVTGYYDKIVDYGLLPH